jgi:hypothetical protein
MISVPSSFRSLPDYIPSQTGVSAKKFIEKTLRVRARLIAENKGNMHQSVLSAYDNVLNWYRFWKPTEEQCAAYVHRHRDLFDLIIPGMHSKCHKAFLNELNLITNGITCTTI